MPSLPDTVGANGDESGVMPRGGETADVMEAIRTPASYELVVDQIRRAIQVGRFLPGQKLPPERELARQLAVSRTTVREAMRVLQGERLVETRRGRAGGAIVLGSSSSPAERRRELRSRLAELQAVFEYRLVVEPAAARLAAQRRTKQDLDRLRRDVQTMDAVHASALADESDPSPVSRFFTLDIDFHHRIAEATRNQLLIAAVEDARAALFLPVGGIFPTLDPRANQFHVEIFEGIEAQDPERAERAMIDHITLTQESLLELSRAASQGR
jgi:GntR family transcriptional repressor for pyruvate dehydrogenase complex